MTLKRILILVGLIGVVIGAWWLHARLSPVPLTVTLTQPTPDSKSIQIDAGKVTPQIITQLLLDPTQQAEAQRLLQENKALHATVTQLTSTLATYESKGAGAFTQVPLTSIPLPLQPSDQVSPVYEFKDHRLTFVAQNGKAQYTLTQTFHILTTTGRDAHGQPMSLVRLYEVLPTGDVPIKDVQTTAIFADATHPHWLVSLAVQGGVGYVVEGASGRAGGLLGAQWLKHGRTRAAADTQYAILTPAVLFTDHDTSWGLLPVSVNLGQMPHQPFQNLWLSPYVDRHRAGVVLSATF